MKQNKKGQILVITLLVLAVLALAMISIILVTNRGAEQVVTTQKYEQIFAASEADLRRVVEEFGDVEEDLNNLPNDENLRGFITSCLPYQTSFEDGYECDLSAENASGLSLVSGITVFDDKEVNDYELFKDESFLVNLDGYNDIFSVTWTDPIALELALVYFSDNNADAIQQQDEPIAQIFQVIDPENVFDSNDTSNPLGITLINNNQGFEMNLSSVSDLQSNNGYPLQLSITVRGDIANNDPVFLSVTPNNPAQFPYQVREFSVESVDEFDETSPFVNLESTIPFNTSLDSIFNYSFITPDTINL